MAFNHPQRISIGTQTLIFLEGNKKVSLRRFER